MSKFGILLNDVPDKSKNYSGLLVYARKHAELLEIITKDFNVDGLLERESSEDVCCSIDEMRNLRDFLNSLDLGDK